MPKHELGALLRDDVAITESYNEGMLFFSGDTTIDLLRGRHREILPKYRSTSLAQPRRCRLHSTQCTN